MSSIYSTPCGPYIAISSPNRPTFNGLAGQPEIGQKSAARHGLRGGLGQLWLSRVNLGEDRTRRGSYAFSTTPAGVAALDVVGRLSRLHIRRTHHASGTSGNEAHVLGPTQQRDGRRRDQSSPRHRDRGRVRQCRHDGDGGRDRGPRGRSGRRCPGRDIEVAAVNGVAIFSNLHVDKAGAGYTLAASASGLTGTTSAAFDIAPATSPIIAFQSSHGIEEIGADGLGRAVLIADSTAFQPAWSPDRARLAFTRTADSWNTCEVYTARADGSGVQQITTPLTQPWCANSPAWSPDGTKTRLQQG